MSTHEKTTKLRKAIYVVALILLLPALLINLGMMAMIDDEGMRALVALEMMLSGNYITPTIYGEFYYNKPPLYNWLLIVFYKLTGVVNEWSSRIPTVVFLLGYASTVFYFFRKIFDTQFAFVMAFVLITCGRIFFYDSMLGLIDICYSWVIFTIFMVIYDQYAKGQFTKLFAYAYTLASVAYLLKGLPTFVFLGLTLLTLFIWKKDYKKLWCWQHFMGVGIFAVIIGGYYLIYLQYNSLDDLFPRLVKQSTRRTALEYGWMPTVKNLFTFHFEQFYHFLPWSILVVYLFQKRIWHHLFSPKGVVGSHDFLVYCMLTFAVNIPLYWSSVQVYPRYLLMFLPLLYAPLVYLHFESLKKETQLSIINRKVFETIILVLSAGVFLLFLAIPYFPQVADSDYLIWKTFFLSMSGAVTLAFLYRKKQLRILLFIIMIILVRIGFDWFVLPDRLKNDRGSQLRITAKEVGQTAKNLPLIIDKASQYEWASGFYVTNERQQIVRKEGLENIDSETLVIIDPLQTDSIFRKEYKLITRHREPKYRWVGYLK